MAFCLIPKLADTFLEKVKSGEIDPAKLQEMSSAERHAFFANFMGEANAKHVNAAFESKLLLKNQQQGIINWAEKMGGLKPDVQRDILARVGRMTKVLEPKDLNGFLSDLAEQKLGFGVSMEEAGRISELAKNVQDAKRAGAGWGKAQVAFDNYVSDLKRGIKKPMTAGHAIMETAGTTKAINATFDDSAIFKQGWKLVFSNPVIWSRNALGTITDAVRTFGGKALMDDFKAHLYEESNYVNGRIKKSGLAVGVREEDFPTALPEKLPLVGRAYKASEVAFTLFQYKNRVDVFNKYLDMAEKLGRDVDNPEFLKNTGDLINDLTSRANLGRAEPIANYVNNVFFSPRKFVADAEFLTAELFRPGIRQDPFLRRQAALNLAKTVFGTAAILTTASFLMPGSVDNDPHSSDFGKIKVGQTRFDISGGMASLVTLASRLVWTKHDGEWGHWVKSSTTGKFSKLNSGKFGGATIGSVIGDFSANKLSPAARVVYEAYFTGEDFLGNKPTVTGELKSLVEPLPFKNIEELLKSDDGAPVLAASIADALGISTNTYTPYKKH